MRRRSQLALLAVSVTVALAAAPAPAAGAFNPVKPICTAAGLFSGLIGKACSVVQHGGRVLDASKNLVTGNLTGAAKSLLGQTGSRIASGASTAIALTAIVAWVVGGASYVVRETATVIGRTTEPQLTSTWFSATYWRVAGIAVVLTLPFLFAAAIQALVQSDITLLVRAAFGYLPLALLAVTIAAPLTMLLLAASDQLSAIVSSAVGNQSGHFLDQSSGLVGALARIAASPFVGFFVALLTVAAALGLWIELLMRAAAVYVIVLMLPLAFAAFVWPARRIWAIRAIELLIALILSKFVIVAVLSLGGAALSQSAYHSVVGVLAGVVILVLGAFAPWTVLRLLPVTEVASAAAGSLRHDGRAAVHGAGRADAWAGEGHAWAEKAAQMRQDARAAEEPDPAGATGGPPGAEPSAPSEAADRPPGAVIAESLAAAAPASGANPTPHAGDGEPPSANGGGTRPTPWRPPDGPIVLGPRTTRERDSQAREHHVDEAVAPGEIDDPTPPPPDGRP